MGLKVGTVKLEKYNNNWNAMYEKERDILLSLLGNRIIEIVHVGSTAIPGLSAKPIIDIMITVKKLSDVENFKSLFKSELGYDFRDDLGVKGEYLVRKGNEDNRTHFIHIIEQSSERYYNFINFKKYLINHPDKVIEYEKLKQDLSNKYSDDRKMYTEGKNEFIKNILELYDKETI